MGGGGSYYDRDVNPSSLSGAGGFTDSARREMSKDNLDRGLLPRDRVIETDAKNPVVMVFDVTGSMGNLPLIIFDKMPMVAGQMAEQGYLDDPEVSLMAVGDVTSDQAPLQVCDFCKIRTLDKWLKRIWVEGNGGGQHFESYEFAMYYYARIAEMPKAEMPFLLITGDEGFREELTASELNRQFGGKHKTVTTAEIIEELKKKFKGNVVLLHKRYGGGGNLDKEITKQWQDALGKERVVELSDDQAIADTTLGIFAIMTGSRTLDEYAEDMKVREQTDARIESVKKSLTELSTVYGKIAKVKKGAPPPIVLPASSKKKKFKKLFDKEGDE